MSTRYPGGLITKTPVVPTLASAPGVWTLEQALAYIKAGTWPYQGALDPYFNQTTLLLHGDGNQGAANFYNSGSPRYLAFTDNSSNNFPITVQGDAYGTTFSPYEGSYGVLFSANSGLTVPAQQFPGDFTWELWYYPTALGSGINNFYSVLIGCGDTAIQNIQVYADTDGSVKYYNGSTGLINSAASIITVNQWHHIALVRSGSTTTLYVNGVSRGSGTETDTKNIVSIGNFIPLNSSYNVRGYLSNVRTTTTAVYTSAFTPPTAPLTAISGTNLLLCQANRFVDNSASPKTVTVTSTPTISPFQPFILAANDSGSGYFDGSGDFLDVPDNPALEIGSNSFCIEAWINPNALPASGGERNILAKWITASRSFAFLYLNASGTMTLRLAYSTNGSTTLTISQAAPIVANAWQHIAITRDGTTARFFLNGVQQGSNQTLSGAIWDSTEVLTIGRFGTGGGSQFDGYLSDLRFVVGSPVYTSNFTPPTAPVTNITNTSLLTCQYSGTVNNTGFIDSGPYYFPITRFGNTTQGTFSPFSVGAGEWSNYFDGTGDYQTITSGVTNQFDPGSAFTLEGWFYQTSTANCIIFEVRGNTDSFANADGILYRLWTNFNGSSYFQFKSGTAVISILGTTPPNNTWNHLAVGYNGTTTRFWINGVSVGISTSSYTVPTYNRVTIGNNNNQSAPNPFFGYLSNMRFVKGSDVYGVSNTTITVPTTPLTAITNTSLLTCQSNRFVDNSTNNFAITRNGDVKVTPFSPFAPTAAYSINVNGGSGYFDGTGDYLTIANNDALNLSGVFTFECWFYLERTTGIQTIASKWVSGTTAWLCDFSSSTFNFYLAQSGAADSINASWTATTGQWYHIAVTRDSSNNVRMFLNGVQIGSTITSTRTASSTSPVAICFNNSGVSGAGHLQGYVSNFRILKGTAVYTANFTPPTAPFTPVANTSLLLNFTSAGIFDQTGKNNLETVGNAQVDTNIRKYGTGSLKFDGTTDYVVQPTSDNYGYGTGDFTIEFWLRLNSTGLQTVFSNLTSDTSTQPHIYLNSTIRYFTASADRITGAALNAGQWYHIVVCRGSGLTRLFIDGVQSGSTYADTNNYGATAPLGIGTYWNAGSPVTVNTLNGFIDDLRITKGVARYTTNFTPPTRAFPNQ